MRTCPLCKGTRKMGNHFSGGVGKPINNNCGVLVTDNLKHRNSAKRKKLETKIATAILRNNLKLLNSEILKL